MILKRSYILFLLVLSTSCFARQPYDRAKEHPDLNYATWLTGPFLSPTPINVEPGHLAFEGAVVAGSNYGNYDSSWNFKNNEDEWFINPFLDFQFGFTDRIGLEVLVSFVSNFKKNTSATRLQDSAIFLGFQIANDIRGKWTPDIRLDLQQVFPTGSYRNLSPDNLGLDSTGQGSFQTGPLLIVQKQFYPGGHPLALKTSLGYLFPAEVEVRGVSAYGGTSLTKGKVNPGQTLTMFISAEYSISRRWGCGFDALYTHQNKATFQGKAGGSFVGLPSSEQFSLAPFIEHTFSRNMGALAGSWFTFGGRNSLAFASGYFAFLYLF